MHQISSQWMDNDPNGRWTARIYPDGTWEANLFQYYRRVLPRLQNFLPLPFQLEGNQRKDETTAHVAVREAFINLCVHADFSVNASLIVKHIKNEFLFSNPGTLLITKAQYYNGGQSVCRNKALQKMFMMLGAAEKAGSGVDKILKGWSDANWRVPYIETTQRPDTVNLYLPMLALLDEDIKQGLVKVFGKGIVNVSHNYLTTLSLAQSEGYVTNERLRYVLNLHRTDITLLLKEMCGKGYLESEGYGRGTKYHIPMKHKGGNLVSNPISNPISKTKKKRMSKEEIQAEIMEVCTDWVSLDYIATTIERSTAYLLSDIIPLMLEEGLIERMFPESPRNPFQKYKKKE